MQKLDNVMIPSYRVFKAIAEHDKLSVAKFLTELNEINPTITDDFFESRYLFARAMYELEDFESARHFFILALENNEYDELVNFYLGNIFLRLRKFSEAKKCFEKALFIKDFFPEARNNLSIVNCSMLQGFIKEADYKKIDWNISSSLNFDVENAEACLDIPIFINNRDRVECFKQQITWFLDAGYRKIFVLDQDSTYPALLDFYSTFRRDSRVHVLRMKNFGHQCVWISAVLEDLDIRTPYVYTDSDMIPSNCPRNLVQELLRSLEKNSFVKKVGARLISEDITCQNRSLFKEICSEYYQDSRLISSNEYFAPVDTTFAVYRNVRHYNCIYSIVRRDISFRHLPWYYDSNNLPIDEKYYIEHANSSSTYKKIISE